MRILSLNLKDFGPFAGFHSLDFSDKSNIVLVTAEYAGAPGRSNRAGKTAILEAIVYLLYGECRVREADFIHHGASDMLVEGQFQLTSGELLTIKRGRTSKNDAIFEVNGQIGSRLQGEIDKLIGVSYKDFTTTNFFQQLDMHGFMEAGATEKQKLLSQWLGNDYWKKYEDAVKEEVVDIESEVTRLTAEKSVLEAQKAPANLNDVLAQANIKQSAAVLAANTLTAQINQLVIERTALLNADSSSKLLAAQTELRMYESRKSELTTKAMNLHNWQQEQDRLTRELTQLKQSYNEAEHRKAEALLKDVAGKQSELRTTIGTLIAQKDQLQASCVGTCPLLNQPCDRVSPTVLAPQIQVLAEKHQEALREAGRVQDINESLGKVRDEYARVLRQIDNVTSKLQTYSPFAVINAADLQQEIASIEALIVATTERVTAAQVGKVDTSSIDAQHNRLVAELAGVNKDKDEASHLINVTLFQLSAEHKRMDRLKELAEVIKVKNQKLSELQVLQYVFSKNGVPLVQLENTFAQLESEINSVLEFLNADCRVVFNSYKELTTKETECSVCRRPFESGAMACGGCGAKRKNKRKEDMSIKLIYSNGAEADFASDSGGGKALISLAVRPALARVIQRGQKNPCNLLLLDEVFANFDRFNRDMVMDALETLFVDRLGFEQILMITHHDISSYGHAFDELRVVRDGTASKVSWT